MGSVEITPVNGDSSFVDPTTSALEQARAMERHFNAMEQFTVATIRDRTMANT